MKYTEVIPHPDLQNYVDKIWIQECSNKQSSRKVLPSGSGVAVFNFSDIYEELNQQTTVKLPRVLLSGQQTTQKVFRTEGQTGLIIVRFQPWGSYALSQASASEFTDVHMDLVDILGKEIVSVQDQLISAKNNYQRLEIIQKFLIVKAQKASVDPLIPEACRKINESGGNIRVAELAEELFVSKRQLERKFKQFIGLTPKQFARIVRFQKSLLWQKSEKSVMTALKSGYCDQSHYIKEFCYFTGVSPNSYHLQRDASELAKFFNHENPSHYYNTVYM